MKLYLSGPMAGYPEHNYPAFNSEATRLRALGWTILNPADHGQKPGWVWEDYLRLDLKDVLECQGIAVLAGWTKSRGANLEVSVARALRMPIYVSEELLTSPDHVHSQCSLSPLWAVPLSAHDRGGRPGR